MRLGKLFSCWKFRFNKSGGFLTKSSSNSERPDSAGDAKVFIAKATTAVYRGHVSPFLL